MTMTVTVDQLLASDKPEDQDLLEQMLQDDYHRTLQEMEDEDEDEDWDDEEDHWGDDDDHPCFADPGGNSALRAATADNPRNLPCPSCGGANRLTPADVAQGYQCDPCADRMEREGINPMLNLMFVTEGIRLDKLGLKKLALVSFQNAWSCRQSARDRLELRAIINRIAIEIHYRKRRSHKHVQ